MPPPAVKISPVLPPPSVEFAPIYHDPVFAKVAAVPPVAVKVQTFPDWPVKLKAVNVLVVPLVNWTVVAPVELYEFVMLANVFDPLMVNVPEPALFNVPKALPPPEKALAEDPVMFMVDDEAFVMAPEMETLPEM